MVVKKRIFLAGLAVLSLGWAKVCVGEPVVSQGEKLPLYEYGVVGLAAYYPHYSGSDEYQTYVFPLPYFVYRGKMLRADREGVRTIFYRYKQFETDISLAGNPPAGDNDAREGMEDLDALGEVGPALNYYFFDYGERDSCLLQATVRAAFSFDFEGGVDVGHEGYVSDISFIFRDSRIFRKQKVRFHLSTGVRFADADMHGYFYDVRQDDVTPDRPSYEADGGYGGLQVSGSITKELTPTFSLSSYGRWVNIDGAVYDDSPLVDTHNNFIVGAMLVWKFGESEEFEP